MWPREPDDFLSAVHGPDNADSALTMLFSGDRVLLASEHGGLRVPTWSDCMWLDAEFGPRHFLGHRGAHPCVTAEVSLRGEPPPGYGLVDLRTLLQRLEPSLFYLVGRARQVLDWHRDHRFCGRCGTEMQDHHADRARECPACALINYPRLSPSIIVLVRDGENMLLARNANWPPGMFSTLAGFVEPGESIEQTVHREVAEEVGVQVGNLRYFGSQSWPFPNSLMLGFHAEYAGGDIVCQQGEIAEARWFHASQPPRIPPATAISRWLIDAFVTEVTGSPVQGNSW